jgi:hypothetical protein
VTTGSLANRGSVFVDAGNIGITGVFVGGSSLIVKGTLTNSGSLSIGDSALAAADTVTATSLDNTGSISVNGSSANQALLDVTAGSAGFGAAGTVTGTVELAEDAAIEFRSGEISAIATGGTLQLFGNSAFVEDSTALGSNSALTGLADVASGALLDLESNASLSIAGKLVNNGDVALNVKYPVGGASLALGGALINNNSLDIGASSLLSSSKVSAPALVNRGSINLAGGSAAHTALVDVTTGGAGFGTAGTLSGSVTLNSYSAIEFLSGQINTIGAFSTLSLVGASAFVEDSTALGSNSALNGLADVAGSLNLIHGAAVSTTGALVNDGTVGLDADFGDQGGSSLTVAKTLTNTGNLNIGNLGLSSSDSVTANSFVNRGTVDLSGKSAALKVSGTTTNNGSISIASDTETLAGAVGGAGAFSLNYASLQFDSSVSAGQAIAEFGASALILKQAQSFAATISGFGAGADTIDATNFLLSGTTVSFVENSARTGGILTLQDGSLTANILMTGQYANANFSLAPDSGTGTLVKFV